MRTRFAALFGWLALAALPLCYAQGLGMNPPKSIQAGSAFEIPTSGAGKATLYIVGQGQVLKRDVQLGGTASFDAGSLTSAGNYLVILAGESATEHQPLIVAPAEQPAHLSFLARPSRLAVGLNNGISGAVYVFDAYNNLIPSPMPVIFTLTPPSGAVQQHKTTTFDGAAWAQLDSTSKEGMDKFVAQAGGVTSKRVVEQVPGEPCRLRMRAQRSGKQLQLQTDPVRDCSGNAVPDGTIVTFTEDYNGMQSTVDVPLKRGIAKVEMPAHSGATITVASGVVLGNEIHWSE